MGGKVEEEGGGREGLRPNSRARAHIFILEEVLFGKLSAKIFWFI